MRTIKFRAWQKNHKKIGRVKSISFNEESEIEHLCFHNGDNCVPVYSNYWKNHKEWDLDNLELMQFTGLKDKNGKEIYEGDIMKITIEGLGFWEKQKDLERIGEVIYNEDYAGFIVEWEYSKNQHHESLNCDIAFTGEVIGNIHENPELLSTSTAVL